MVIGVIKLKMLLFIIMNVMVLLILCELGSRLFRRVKFSDVVDVMFVSVIEKIMSSVVRLVMNGIVRIIVFVNIVSVIVLW